MSERAGLTPISKGPRGLVEASKKAEEDRRSNEGKNAGRVRA